MKILWLCSWYPSKEEPFNGDFIQRHAKAAALFNTIHVIHITNDFKGAIEGTGTEIKTEGNLTEQIIYFKKNKSITAFIFNQLRWLALYKKAIRNYIIKNGKPDIVHVHIPMKSGLLALWIKKNYKIPYLLTEHWGVYNAVIGNGYEGKSYAFKQLTKKIFKNAAGFLTVSKYLAEGINKMVCKKEYRVILNTVDTDFFFYKEKVEKIFRFIHVSNMVPLKNPEGILRAYKKFLEDGGKGELLMIGNKNEALITYANTLELPTISYSFRGEIPYEEVAAEMQGADTLILFSDIENSPCVIGEALCCGLPVIATNVGGIPELVDETNAILISSKDESSLTNAMHQMVQNRSQYAHKKIAETAQGKFSNSVIGNKIDTAYFEIFKELETGK